MREIYTLGIDHTLPGIHAFGVPFFFLAKTNQHETVGQSRRIAALPIGWKSFQIHLSSHRFSYRSIMEFQFPQPHMGEPKKTKEFLC